MRIRTRLENQLDFKVGDKVVYPNHGVGVIEEVRQRAVGDIEASFYCLKILATDSTVMVPVNNTQAVGLRKVLTRRETTRVVKLLKLFTASALFEGRSEANDADFFILKHIWNNLDQRDILRDIVDPVLEAYFERNPRATRAGGAPADVESLVQEVQLIEKMLSSGQPVSDIQLFSQLRNLSNVKAALLLHDSPTAKEVAKRVDNLLESVFKSSKFE